MMLYSLSVFIGRTVCRDVFLECDYVLHICNQFTTEIIYIYHIASQYSMNNYNCFIFRHLRTLRYFLVKA